MNRRAVLIGLVAVLVTIAGCGGQTPNAPTTEDPAATTDGGTGTTVDTTTGTPTGTTDDGATSIADPASDVLGWENGLWYNETLPINESDGLNATELGMVVNRSMARVEQIRELEFETSVPVEVVSRQEYRDQYASTSNSSEPLKVFDNVKFEALFLVGEEEDSLAVQESNRGSNVLGFYSPDDDQIVVVSESETPRVTETTLGHELVHALQDQYFDLNSINSSTREAHNARNGVVEGDARYVDQRYDARCGGAWRCTTQPGDGGAGNNDLHLGVYLMKYFPYSDGPGFVGYTYQRGGWEAVNQLYENPPESSEQVSIPEKYGQESPRDVDLPDRSDADWQRVSPPGRAPYASVGIGSILAMFAYPAYDQSREGEVVVGPRTFLNLDGNNEVNSSDPINYVIDYTRGWGGDKMWIYENGDGEHAYVWRLVWDSPDDATEFAEGYRELLQYWGGERVTEGNDDLWRIPEGESPFADAFYVHVEGDTVTVVNAPTAGQLPGVWEGAPTS